MSTGPETTAILQGTCGYCGGYHVGMCHRIKSIKYHQNGTVSEVELWPSDHGWPAPTVTVTSVGRSGDKPA